MNDKSLLVGERGQPVAAPVMTEVFVPGAASEIPAPDPKNEDGTPQEFKENIPLSVELKAGKWFMPGPGFYVVRDGEYPMAALNIEQALILAGKAQEKWGQKKWAIVRVDEVYSAMPEQDAKDALARRKAQKKGGGK